MIEDGFHRLVESADGDLEVIRADGGQHVSVYAGPFALQIALVDLSAVIRYLSCVLSSPRHWPAIPLECGSLLHIGIGGESDHVWLSAAAAHLRLPAETANALLGALSEARYDIDRQAVAVRRKAEEGAAAA